MEKLIKNGKKKKVEISESEEEDEDNEDEEEEESESDGRQRMSSQEDGGFGGNSAKKMNSKQPMAKNQNSIVPLNPP